MYNYHFGKPLVLGENANTSHIKGMLEPRERIHVKGRLEGCLEVVSYCKLEVRLLEVQLPRI
jgi:hypothetical protein